MIDVFEDIKKFLVFEDKNDFYYLQIIKRKKDDNNKTTLIKSYYINNLEYLNEKYEDIKSLCNFYNARAMLRLNKRNYRKVSLMSLKLLANSIVSKDYKTSRKIFEQACGRWNSDNNKKWIIDLDEEYSSSELLELRYVLKDLRPKGDKWLIQLPTKSGIHIVTSVFDLTRFKSKYPDLGVHKDNPINLYIP